MPRTAASADSDTALAARIVGRDEQAFELLMRRYNSRLFRVARAILKDDSDAEDTLQDSYLDAYRHIQGFRGDANLATWLTRIVINQALMRVRKRKREQIVVSIADASQHEGFDEANVGESGVESPSDAVIRGDVRRILERHIDRLPSAFRVVLVMRDVEDMTVAETAACLGIPEPTVRTRLFRARGLMRDALARDLDTASAGLFGFDGARCDRIVAAVLARIRAR